MYTLPIVSVTYFIVQLLRTVEGSLICISQDAVEFMCVVYHEFAFVSFSFVSLGS